MADTVAARRAGETASRVEKIRTKGFRPRTTLGKSGVRRRNPWANADHAAVGSHLRLLFEAGTVTGVSDGHLLEMFVSRRDELAFTALVERHGPMVRRVCHAVLGDHHDAQDAFQATFLVLARSAGSIRQRDSLASWLYGVALRVAARCPFRLGAATRAREELGRPACGRDAERHGEPGRPRGALARGDRPASRAVSRAGGPLLSGRPDLRGGGAGAPLSGRDHQEPAVHGPRAAAPPVGASESGDVLRIGRPGAPGRSAHDDRARAVAGATLQAVIRNATGGLAPASISHLTQGVLETMLWHRLFYRLGVAAAILIGTAALATGAIGLARRNHDCAGRWRATSGRSGPDCGPTTIRP